MSKRTKKKKAPKRNAAARALADPLYRQRKVPNKTKYNRKKDKPHGAHPAEGEE